MMNEEIIFGGPKLYIREEENGRTGMICVCSHDLKHLTEAIRMFTVLRKNGYPAYFHEYEKVYRDIKDLMNKAGKENKYEQM